MKLKRLKNLNNSSKSLNFWRLKFIYWGPKYKDTFLSIDTNKNRYVFGLRHFKYYGKSKVIDLI